MMSEVTEMVLAQGAAYQRRGGSFSVQDKAWHDIACFPYRSCSWVARTGWSGSGLW
jgi:hypothetical protein